MRFKFVPALHIPDVYIYYLLVNGYRLGIKVTDLLFSFGSVFMVMCAKPAFLEYYVIL